MISPTTPEGPALSFSLFATQLFDGERLLGPRRVDVREGRIEALAGGGAAPDPARVERLDPEAVLAPGFIDLQVNGGGDVLLNDEPTAESVARIAAAHLAAGTTGLCPTLITDRVEKTEALLAGLEAARRSPAVVGFHLEGPHISLERRGAHPAEHVRPPGAEDLRRLAAFAAQAPTIATVAPEVVEAWAVRALAEAGVRVSLGHSAAPASVATAAFAAGATGVTHLFNAMSQLTGREPGLVGAALDAESAFVGIICDGLHVDPVGLRLARRVLGPERLMLISDAMPTVGGRRGGFTLHGRPIRLEGGRLTDAAGTLAGAHLTMAEALANMTGLAGADFASALRMATSTPAAFLGLGDGRGRLTPGGRADMVALDAATRPQRVWLGGVPVAAEPPAPADAAR